MYAAVDMIIRPKILSMLLPFWLIEGIYPVAVIVSRSGVGPSSRDEYRSLNGFLNLHHASCI